MTDRTDPPRLDLRMRISLAAVGVCAIALSLAALLGFGVGTAVSVAVGGAIAFFNLWLLARIIAALLPPSEEAAEREDAPGQSRAGWAVLAVLKMFGLIAAVWLLMRHGIVSPLPMVVGFGSLPIGIAIGSLVSDRSAA